MSKHFDPNDYSDAERRALARVIDIGGRRTKRAINEQQAISKALKATVEPVIVALAGNPLLLELFAEFELNATKTNAARIAAHPLRPEGVDAAVARRRLAEEANASSAGPDDGDRLQG